MAPGCLRPELTLIRSEPLAARRKDGLLFFLETAVDCIFCQILAGELPGTFVYRDASVAVFMDRQPVNPGHLLVVPIRHAALLAELPPELAARMMAVASQMTVALRGSKLRCEGVNLFLADGAAAGQEILHAHLHVFPRFSGDGFGLQMPEGYALRSLREELEAAAERIRHALGDAGARAVPTVPDQRPLTRVVKTELQLIEPALSWRAAFLAMAADYHQAGEDRYAAAIQDFDAFVGQLLAGADTRNLPAGWVPASTYWLADGPLIVGASRLRFWLVPHLEHEGGHIGYDIRPSARRRGYGRRILALTLEKARARGLTRVLVTCDTDNRASAKVIEANGGVRENQIRSERTGNLVSRYWIDLSGPHPTLECPWCPYRFGKKDARSTGDLKG